MSKIYLYKTSETKEIYDFEQLYDLLKINENRTVIIRTENRTSNIVKESEYKLHVEQDKNNLIINSIIIPKVDIYDVYSGTYFGNSIMMNIDNDDLFTELIIIIREKKMIDGHDTNLSFKPNNYWKKVCQIYNNRYNDGITKFYT